MLDVLSLTTAMDQLAAATWAKIVYGDAWGLKFREESITDSNLFALAARHPALIIDKHTAHRERGTGADWEWWVGSDAQGWVVLRCQAKRVHGHCYDSLRHRGELPGEYQFDTLIRGCAQLPAHYPLHIFYNGWGPEGHTRWPAGAVWNACPCPPGTCTETLLEHYGCAYAHSADVRDLVRTGGPESRDAAAHLSLSLPWSRLFSAPLVAVAGAPMAALRTYPPRWIDAYLGGPGGWLDDFQRLLLRTRDSGDAPLPRATAPAYVRRLLSGRIEPVDQFAPEDLVPAAALTVVLDVAR